MGSIKNSSKRGGTTVQKREGETETDTNIIKNSYFGTVEAAILFLVREREGGNCSQLGCRYKTRRSTQKTEHSLWPMLTWIASLFIWRRARLYSQLIIHISKSESCISSTSLTYRTKELNYRLMGAVGVVDNIWNNFILCIIYRNLYSKYVLPSYYNSWDQRGHTDSHTNMTQSCGSDIE